MTEDLGTTQRKPLTSAQRLKLFEAHRGHCWRCTRKIEAGEQWVDEHIRALGLGGGNEWENRAPVNVACADAKTHDEDMPAIVKAKAVKRRNLGIKPAGVQSIQSAPFPKFDKPSKSERRKSRRRRFRRGGCSVTDAALYLFIAMWLACLAMSFWLRMGP